ncbi:hypothetical protein GGX14DRAFT_567400 [Mycena pura]|uniref:HAT C-terminal dimerisation domain-containing protein n=1 Tax=Mycena pura TaxID=153505 RepID=A0AAD6VAJ7_9AGAR|nr:hypothetical protein GGX14DRAFT_567400 [Mycena pura]
MWWKGHEREFKPVSRMACDFLAIQCLRSGTRYLCRETRASMKSDIITEAMLPKMWIMEGLPKEATLDRGQG